MRLEKYFINVKYDCYLDAKGVYVNDTKVALSNSEPNGYCRFDAGNKTVTPVDIQQGLYNLSIPMVFVGAVPNADPVALETATVSALVGSDVVISSYTNSKAVIGTSELLDLSKFDNVALVLVRYVVTKSVIYDPRCDIDVSICC